MPDPKENPELEQVPSPEGATEEELTLEKISKMEPQELFDLYKNSREAIGAATQRNQETRKEQERLEREREYFNEERQRYTNEIQRYQDQLAQYNELIRQSQPQQRTNYDEITPEEAWKQTLEGQQKYTTSFEEYKKEQEQKLADLKNEISATQRAIEYRDFLKEKVFSQYEDVSQRDLDDYFTEHPNLPANPNTVLDAAKTIHDVREAEIEARVQERMKKKEELAKQADIVGDQGLASLDPEKPMIFRDEDEQREIIEQDIRKMEKYLKNK